MRVIQVVPAVDNESSGPSYSVVGLTRGLVQNQVDAELHVPGGKSKFCTGMSVFAYPRKTLFHLRGIEWSPKMLQGLKEACQAADIIHNNSLWMMPNVYPWWACKGTRCKLVVAPRGTLATWSLKKGWLKKKIFGWLFQNAVLRNADMFHATCEKEYDEIRALGYKQPVAIVPIGMDLPTRRGKTTEHTEYTEGCCAQDCQCDGNKTTEDASRQSPVASGEFPSATHSGAYWPEGLTTEGVATPQDCQCDRKPQNTQKGASRQFPVPGSQFPVLSSEQNGCDCVASRDNRQLATCRLPLATEHNRLRRIVFFGRIHKVKAVDHLVKAWGQVQESLPDWELVIAGPDCGAKGELEAIIAEEQIPRVRFVGEINGQAKYDFLTEADIYVLPSHTENFGVTVAEALACGTPTIASQGTPWEGLETEKCGKWVPIGVEPLAEALRELTSLTDDERAAMGERGRAWIQRDFSWDGIGAKMKAAYAWLLGQGEKPDFVRVD